MPRMNRRCAAAAQPATLAASLALMAAMRAESTRVIWPAPMPAVRAVLGIDDGVGLHMLAHGEGEQHVGDFLFAGLALGHDFQLRRA